MLSFVYTKLHNSLSSVLFIPLFIYLATLAILRDIRILHSAISPGRLRGYLKSNQSQPPARQRAYPLCDFSGPFSYCIQMINIKNQQNSVLSFCSLALISLYSEVLSNISKIWFLTLWFHHCS